MLGFRYKEINIISKIELIIDTAREPEEFGKYILLSFLKKELESR